MNQEPQSRWRQIIRNVLWTVGIYAALVVAIIIVLGYVREWEWTGLVKDKAYTKRTLWDWLKLLIIPAVLAGVGLWFNRQQRAQELQIARQQREQELQSADRRAQDEALQAYLDQMSDMLIPNKDQSSLSDEHPLDSLKTVARARTLTVLPRLARATQAAAERRAQEEALQAYLDNMAEMLIPNNDQPSLYDENPPESLRVVARARTLTVLPRLAGDGKGRVVQFLRESKLIQRVVRDAHGEVVQDTVVDLSGANLRDAHLSRLNLRGVVLEAVALERADLTDADLGNAYLGGSKFSGAVLWGADLEGAYLSGAILWGANLSNAELEGANLSRANLSGAILEGANLSDTNLWGAYLSGAYLSGAILSGANLSGAVLSPRAILWGADLSGADLSGADLYTVLELTEEQLYQAKSLKGATMPDGTILQDDSHPNRPTFEEWRKSREGQG